MAKCQWKGKVHQFKMMAWINASAEYRRLHKRMPTHSSKWMQNWTDSRKRCKMSGGCNLRLAMNTDIQQKNSYTSIYNYFAMCKDT